MTAKPTNKARILNLVPKIFSMRQEGYYLSDIFQWLRDTDQVNCSFSNFKKYYYGFAKTQRTNLVSYSTRIEDSDGGSPDDADDSLGDVSIEEQAYVDQPGNESVTVLIVPRDLFDLSILKQGHRSDV